MSKDDTAKIADFGVSAVTDEGDGRGIARGLGTPAYMAPEVLRAEHISDAAATDMWSLGSSSFTVLRRAQDPRVALTL